MDIEELRKYIMSSSDNKDPFAEDTEKEEIKEKEPAPTSAPAKKRESSYKSGGLELSYLENEGGYAVLALGGYDKSSLIIPATYKENDVIEIGDSAFVSGADFLESISIPPSVRRVSASAFDGCDMLLKEENGVFYADKWVVDCVDDESFARLVIKEGTVGIAKGALKKCKCIKEIVLPSTLVYICDGAFGYCQQLTTVTLPVSIKEIGRGAFEGCSSLEHIVLPDGIVRMGESVFSDCGALKSAVLPKGLTRIEGYTFAECEALKDVTFPKSLTDIGEKAFSNCRSITKITVPDTVTTIEQGAFSGCEALVSVTLPESGSLTRIEDKAFYSCESLKSIFIPESVLHMGYQVFSWCTSLTSYCQPKKKGNDWDKKWNEYSSRVMWGHNHSTKYSTCECGKHIANPTGRGGFVDRHEARCYLPSKLISLLGPLVLLALGYGIFFGGESWRQTWLFNVGFANFFSSDGGPAKTLIASGIIVGLMVIAAIVVGIVMSAKEGSPEIIGGIIGGAIFFGYPIVGIAFIIVRALIAIIGSLIYVMVTPVGVLCTGGVLVLALLILRRLVSARSNKIKSVVGIAAIALFTGAVYYLTVINTAILQNLL